MKNHLLILRIFEPPVDTLDEEPSEEDVNTLYCVTSDEKSDEAKRELGRVPLLAVFHRMAHEKGVPHSYISELRRDSAQRRP